MRNLPTDELLLLTAGLLRRLEASTGADRRLDAEILCALLPYDVRPDGDGGRVTGGTEAPPYTGDPGWRQAAASALRSVIETAMRWKAAEDAPAEAGLPRAMRELLFREIPEGKDWRARWDRFLSFAERAGHNDARTLDVLLEALDADGIEVYAATAEDHPNEVCLRVRAVDPAQADWDGVHLLLLAPPEATAGPASKGLADAIVARWDDLRALRRTLAGAPPSPAESLRTRFLAEVARHPQAAAHLELDLSAAGPDVLWLDRLEVTGPRSSGLGTWALRTLTALCDGTDVQIALRPDPSVGGRADDDAFDSLRGWYRKRGFFEADDGTMRYDGAPSPTVPPAPPAAFADAEEADGRPAPGPR